jgi:hypothetical protein
MKKIQIPFSIIATIFIIASCVSPVETETPGVTLSSSSTPDIPKSTTVVTRITSTQSPVPSATWTPLPTLSLEESERIIVDLFESNGDCKLPCWWGAVLGETRWEEVEQFLATFATGIGEGQARALKEDDGYHQYTNYGVDYVLPGHQTVGQLLYGVRDQIVISVRVQPPGTEFGYQLHQFLSYYGQPQEVYVFTYSNVPSNVIPFRVLVRYQDQGFYAIYEYPAEINGDTISACPDSSGPSLHLRIPNQPYEKYLVPFEDVARRELGMNKNQQLIDLRTATKMDVKSFYETFRNQHSGTCLQTLVSMW